MASERTFKAAVAQGEAMTLFEDDREPIVKERKPRAERTRDHEVPTVEELAAAGPVDIEAPSPRELSEAGGLFDAKARPPYHLPTTGEILRTPSNGYTWVSTFSGCGGSSLGARWAGWRVPIAVEFVDAARATYLANFVTSLVIGRDIRQVEPQQILDYAGLARGELDCLEGSPPCASFSTIGARDRHWGKQKAYSDTKQRTDDLFGEYVRLLEGLMPRTFVAENVAGMAVGQANEVYLKRVLEWFGDVGYRVAAAVLEASSYGVPQIRPRLIFVGVRDDLRDARGERLMPRHPRPYGYKYTLRDALRWAGPPPPEERRERRFDDYAIGAEWFRMTEGTQSTKYFMLERCELSKPCPTMTVAGQSEGSKGVSISAPCHPREPRKFCLDEIRSICGFPRDFTLTGSYGQRVERLCRAVPPPFMRAIARTVADLLDEAA